ncbi:5-(carboxyamino)imidazole ribonucleotide synthase [Priestia taiwanensis]
MPRILPGSTIGIIGGGQLGRMMALSAKEMGYRIAVLDPTPNSPCAQVADIEIVGAYDDMQAIKKLHAVSDVITYEFENINYEALTWLEEHANLPQGSSVLQTTQNRFLEKSTIAEMGINVAPFRRVTNAKDLKKAIQDFQMPCVVKTTTGGYDGKGQVVIRKQRDIQEALQLVEATECIVEKWITFAKELSVIVVRSVTGESEAFPVAENIHVNNILHQSIVPARISRSTEKKAIDYAMQIANKLEVVGTLAVEMFVTDYGDLYINELAPRPHNSGHYTMDACMTCQFEQHIRAICGWPLGETTLLKKVVMVNILGEHLDAALRHIPYFPGVKLHLYGKKEAKYQRKMGHLNVLHDNLEEALQMINAWNIWSKERELMEVQS